MFVSVTISFYFYIIIFDVSQILISSFLQIFFVKHLFSVKIQLFALFYRYGGELTRSRRQQFKPLFKRKTNKVWIDENGEGTHIAKSRGVQRILYVLFFDARNPVVQMPYPKNASVTYTVYAAKMLPGVVEHYETIFSHTGTLGRKLFHNNAAAHNFAVAIEYLQANSLKFCKIVQTAMNFISKRLLAKFFDHEQAVFQSHHAVGSYSFPTE